MPVRVGHILPAPFLNLLLLLLNPDLGIDEELIGSLMRDGEPHGFDHNSRFQNNKR